MEGNNKNLFIVKADKDHGFVNFSEAENSIVGEIHDDRDNNPNIRDIVRLYGYVLIGDDKNFKSKAYSYEVTKIELLEGFSATTHTHSADFVPTSNNSISACKDTNFF